METELTEMQQFALNELIGKGEAGLNGAWLGGAWAASKGRYKSCASRGSFGTTAAAYRALRKLVELNKAKEHDGWFYVLHSFYFTCGSAHSHTIDNAVWDKDSVLHVLASTEELAMEKVFWMFGAKWSHCYPADGFDMSYFPKGLCGLILA